MHDRTAELRGLRNELAHCENGPREASRGRAGQVREQIDRLRGELADEAEALEQRSEVQAADGQDVPAAQSATAARDLRTLLDQDGPDTKPKGRTAGAGKRNTAAPKAPEQT